MSTGVGGTHVSMPPKTKTPSSHPVFAANFKRIKAECGPAMTYQHIAAALEVSFGAVTKWRDGKAEPKGSTLIKLARLLRCHPNAFYEPRPTAAESRHARPAK